VSELSPECIRTSGVKLRGLDNPKFYFDKSINMTIIKTDREIETMRQGGRILAAIMVELVKAVAPGVTTAELEQLALDLIKAKGARSAFKGYQSIHEARSFPTALCASINQQIVHAPALAGGRTSPGSGFRPV
jgi:hypothetical protein